MQYKILSPLLLSTLILGCVDAEKEPATDTFDAVQEAAKADFLGSEMNVVNAAALPADLTVDHTANPRYSAVSFKSKANSKLDLWVRSSASDPVAWLLDSNFKILAQNDDTEEGTNSHIKIKAPKAGTYYLAFRDYYEDAGTFKVSLKGEGEKPTTDTSDPFSADSCAGPTMSPADALTLFAPGSNSTGKIGEVSHYTRKRICSTLTGCQSWSRVPNPGTLYPGWIEDRPIVHSCGGSGCSTGAGRFMYRPEISILSSGSTISLSLDTYMVEGSQAIGSFRAEGEIHSNGAESLLFQPARNHAGSQATFFIKLGETVISEVPVTLTNTCVRSVLNGQRQLNDPAQVLELETVFLGQIQP